MIFAALQEAASRGRLLLVDGGMCRYHVRRDGVLVIREVIVLPAQRRRGIGRNLVRLACSNHHGIVIAKCPTAYESNYFWRSIGFRLESTEGNLNKWRLDLL